MPTISFDYPTETGTKLPVTISVPAGKERDKEFIKKASTDYLKARYPNEFTDTKTEPAIIDKVQGVKNPVMAPQGPKSEGGQGNRPYVEPGEPGYNLPMDTFIGGLNKAIVGPMTSETWQGKAADVGEGLMTAASVPMAPSMLANPVLSGKMLLGGTVGGKIGEMGADLFGASPETKRLASFGGNIAGGAAGMSPKIRGGFAGAAKQVAVDAVDPNGGHYYGMPVSAPVAGAVAGSVLGSRTGIGGEMGAVAGAAIPSIGSAARGFKAGMANKPLIDPIITDALTPSPTQSTPSPAMSASMPARPQLPSPTPQMPGQPMPGGFAGQMASAPPPTPTMQPQLPSAQSTQMPPASANINPFMPRALPAPGPAPRSMGGIAMPAPIENPNIVSNPSRVVKPPISPAPAIEPAITPEVIPPVTKPTALVEKPGSAKDILSRAKKTKPAKTEEIKPDVQSKETEAAKSVDKTEQPDTSKSSKVEKAENQDAEAVLEPQESRGKNDTIDKLAAAADPTWSPGNEVSHEHLGKIADALGVNYTQLGNALHEAGYTVQPSKFRAWGSATKGKKDLNSLFEKFGNKKMKDVLLELSGDGPE